MSPSTSKIIIILLVTASTALAQGPEPDPWWKNVEDTQELLIKWIGLVTFVGTALIGAVFGLWMLVMSKLKEVRQAAEKEFQATKERLDRQTQERHKLEHQVTAIALNTPTALNKPNESPRTQP